VGGKKEFIAVGGSRKTSSRISCGALRAVVRKVRECGRCQFHASTQHIYQKKRMNSKVQDCGGFKGLKLKRMLGRKVMSRRVTNGRLPGRRRDCKGRMKGMEKRRFACLKETAERTDVRLLEPISSSTSRVESLKGI